MTQLTGVPAFVHVAEQASFRAAARILGVTPTAVSRAVSRLEARLGVVLLQRSSRSVTLTPEGALYLRCCQEALGRLQAGEDLLTRAAEVAQGELTVTLPRIYGRPLVARLGALLTRYPRLNARLVLTDREVGLAEERVDVAIRVGELADSSLIARRLRAPTWVTLAAPSYLSRAGPLAHPRDLAAHACLRFARPAGGVTDWRFTLGGQIEVLRTESALRLDDGDLLVDAAIAGLGVVQVFDFMAQEPVRRGELVEVLQGYEAEGPPLHALALAGRHQVPKVRAFLDFATEVFGRGSASGALG